ncbi:hypothetical protein NFI96_026660, partial [Prochilodus magdalenae]
YLVKEGHIHLLTFLFPPADPEPLNLCSHGVVSHGLNLPEYIQRNTLNDVTIFYHDSNVVSKMPRPDWLNSTAGQWHWNHILYWADRNRELITLGFNSAVQQFNRTGFLADSNIYQGWGCCTLYPSGTSSSSLTHKFNGKDFASFDLDRKVFVPAVPEAFVYKNQRARDEQDLKELSDFYTKVTVERLKVFKHAPALRTRKVPEVRIFEKQNASSITVTCHVTGFYPRPVQVDWLSSDPQAVDEGVTDVLPNEDGTYQTRKSLIVPVEDVGKHTYSCVVLHSSVPHNITTVWGKMSSLTVDLHYGNCAYWTTSNGFGLPEFTERIVLNDVTIYYHDSSLSSKMPRPDWLNSTEGKELWNIIHDWSDYNRHVFYLGLQSAVQQFNLTGSLSDRNIYQASGCCFLYPNATYKAQMTHAFNGKDFVSFDVERRTFVAAVPEAVMYKNLRLMKAADIEVAATYYQTNCLERLNILKQAPGLHTRKVPEVRIFEKRNAGSITVTCHVTGFYPRPIQVDWFGPDQQPVNEGFNEVLPNEDGTYQIRKRVIVPEEDVGKHTYSCVVLHSSVPHNITTVWEVEKRSRIALGTSFGFMLLVIGCGLWRHCRFNVYSASYEGEVYQESLYSRGSSWFLIAHSVAPHLRFCRGKTFLLQINPGYFVSTDPDTLCLHVSVSRGFNLPDYVQRTTLNDVTVFYYDSNMESKMPRPDWINSTAGQEHWISMQVWADHNRQAFSLGFQSAVQHFNQSESVWISVVIEVSEDWGRLGLGVSGSDTAVPRGCCPEDAAQRMLPRGRCPEDGAQRMLPTEPCPQNPAPQDAAPQDAAPQDAAPQDSANWIVLVGSLSDHNVYQGMGCCSLYPNGTYQSLLTHTFNGKDFLSLDIDSNTFVAAVPQAVVYKQARDADTVTRHSLAYYYRIRCRERLEIMKDAPAVRIRKVPEVRIFEKRNAGSVTVTCHVTGFYPRPVQVDWLGSDHRPVDEGVTDVLPNEDGTYQTRKRVIVPEEDVGKHTYSCVVLHSSVPHNITRGWAAVLLSWALVAMKNSYRCVLFLLVRLQQVWTGQQAPCTVFSDSESLSLCSHLMKSSGLNLPEYAHWITLNDVTIFYYDSDKNSKMPHPDWLNTTTGQQFWKLRELREERKIKLITAGFESAVSHFNMTGFFSDRNIYQGTGCCFLYPNGTYKVLLTHAFNGKDFITFDVDRKTAVAVVPQAVWYKNHRESDPGDIEELVTLYKTHCLEQLSTFKHVPGVHMRKVPEVRIFEKRKAGSIIVTCQVTGFYPRPVQVDWLGSDYQPVDEGVSEVLPNEDGTYQTRKSLIVPEEDVGKHTYSCVVLHSSVPHNITRVWVVEKRSRNAVWTSLVFICLLVIGFGVWIWRRSKNAVK